MAEGMNKHLARMRYALESVAEEDREAIVRLAEAAACVYSEEEFETQASVSAPTAQRPIIWKRS